MSNADPDEMTLRIQRSVERSLIILTLTGRIQADHVPDLEALMKSESADGDIVLDLRHVRLVDRDAVQFLASREAAGTELRNCSPYIREWITQEKNVMQRKEAENEAGFSG
jgi:anti-anti-sigma regulatory factor